MDFKLFDTDIDEDGKCMGRIYSTKEFERTEEFEITGISGFSREQTAFLDFGNECTELENTVKNAYGDDYINNLTVDGSGVLNFTDTSGNQQPAVDFLSTVDKAITDKCPTWIDVRTNKTSIREQCDAVHENIMSSLSDKEHTNIEYKSKNKKYKFTKKNGSEGSKDLQDLLDNVDPELRSGCPFNVFTEDYEPPEAA